MKNHVDLHQELIALPPEQLKSMLQAETRKPVPDDDLVLAILHILDKQEAGKPIELNDREKAAWRKYQASVIRRGNPLQPVLRTAGAMAASLALILLLIFAALPQEASAGGIFDVISWCNEMALRLFSPGKEQAPLEYEFQTEHPGLQKLYDTLVEYGYDGPAVPMWIPEEYTELLKLEADVTSRCATISASFSNGINELIFKINIFDGAVPRGYYKDNPDAKELEIYGTMHYLLQNKENCTATWTEENIAGCITLDCQEDVLQEILKTIYVMEAK